MTKESVDASKKEVSTTSTHQFQCPMLKPSKYSLWAIRRQIILKANGLWEMIEPLKTTQPDNKKDKTVITFLYQALPEEQLLQITKHKTAKVIWDALKSRHIGEQRVQQARLQTLKSTFEMLHMKEDETIDTFTGKLTTLVNKAANLGHTIEHQTLVQKLLNVVPDRYLQIVASIEQYFDLSEMTMEEAIGRLKTYEERIKYKKGKERKDGETSHRNFNRNNFKKSSYDTSKLQCFKCKKIGHIAPNCPQRTNANEQSNLVEEDLEPTLLMAILEDSNEGNQVKEVKEQKVSLHEEDIGYKETNMDSLWYLDNGASNHMTKVREYFKELAEKVSGKVRFGDGTKDYGITYKHNEGNKIHGFSDSSYGVNTQEGKGTTGIIFYYGESPISWSTQKQATVALSSCESEFIAATAAATQALWLKRLLSKLTHSQEEKVTIMVDNKSAIALMKNPVFHGRSKHIDTKYHFIRECVEKEDIQVEFVFIPILIRKSTFVLSEKWDEFIRFYICRRNFIGARGKICLVMESLCLQIKYTAIRVPPHNWIHDKCTAIIVLDLLLVYVQFLCESEMVDVSALSEAVEELNPWLIEFDKDKKRRRWLVELCRTLRIVYVKTEAMVESGQVKLVLRRKDLSLLKVLKIRISLDGRPMNDLDAL
ncbi:zinc finger, CCHC-type containing protein [Tanacetum coccineum]